MDRYEILEVNLDRNEYIWLQLDSNPEPLSSETNAQPFGQTETRTWHDKNIQKNIFVLSFLTFDH